jgi:hypothetical protein
MYYIKILLSLIAILIALTACTNDPSNIGFNGSNFDNFEAIIPITNMSAYKDSLNIYKHNDRKLILGSYAGIESRILIKFANLPPDSLLTVDPVIRLFIRYRYEPNSFTSSISMAQIDGKNFMPNEVNWEKYNKNEEWSTLGGDYKNIVDYQLNVVEKDSLKLEFQIDKEIVKQWINEPDENYGLILFTNNLQNSFIEFYSTYYNTSDKRPVLVVNDSLTKYEANASAFIYSMIEENNNIDASKFTFSGIPPRSIYLKIDLPDSLNGEHKLKSIILNKAEIELSVNKQNTLTMPDDSYSFSYAMPREEHEEPQDMVYGIVCWDVGTSTIYNGESNKIIFNFTKELPYYLSGSRPNSGIYIINNQANKDFSHIEIHGVEAGDYSPKIRIKYSIPK